MKPYYERGGIVIFHGDCKDVLPSLSTESKDFVVVTDPPYSIGHVSGWSSTWGGTAIANDHDTSTRDEVLQLLRACPMLIFGTWKARRPECTRAILIFDKGAAFGMGDLSFPWKNSHEEIYVIGDTASFTGRRDESVIKGCYVPFAETAGRCHPNEKPLSLMRYLVGKTIAPVVIDPFMGSGTTLRAAKDLGRRAIGIEIEEKYCEIAAKRLEQEVLFGIGAEAARIGLPLAPVTEQRSILDMMEESQ